MKRRASFRQALATAAIALAGLPAGGHAADAPADGATAASAASTTPAMPAMHAMPAMPAATPLPPPSAGTGELVVHPWVVPPPNWSPEAYFTNLKDGSQVEAPFVARFGLSMRGIVQAGTTAGTAGHHHLLINQPLPLDFSKPLPFTDQYIHFGKGQMEAVVDLPPGTYTMRLVLADQGHIPYFVYSKPLAFTVTKQNKGVTAASLLGPPHIEMLSPADRESVRLPVRLQFHASGYNMSVASARLPDTGHFRLTLERPGQKTEVLEMDGGQTEVWLSPPRGSYTARLELMSNTAVGTVMAKAKPVSFIVP